MTALTSPRQALNRLPPGKPNEFIWRCSLDKYHAMIDEGILTDDDPVELLEGWLVAKMPKNPLHSLLVELLRDQIEALLQAGWVVRQEQPVTLPADQSEPEPDLAIVRGDKHRYREQHPGPGDIAFVVEIADSTVSRDRGIKMGVYARSSIAEYWVVNLFNKQVEVYTTPTGPEVDAKYQHCRTYKLGEEVPVVIDGKELGRCPAAAILGEPKKS